MAKNLNNVKIKKIQIMAKKWQKIHITEKNQ